MKQPKEIVECAQAKQETTQEQALNATVTKLVLQSIGEEFSRPIGLILNNCEYLSEHLSREKSAFSPEKTSGAIADINHSALHLNRLVENFIEMTACLNGALQTSIQMVDLVSMLKDICADSAEIYDAIGITLQLDFAGLENAFVLADRTLAERICLNLLSNALHACTKGEQVTFQLRQNQDGYVLCVIDDGYGFPPENVLSAFESFVGRTGEKPKGFERGGGMGLYLCGEYCRLMQWKIGISLQNPGTQVHIDIPKNENLQQQTVRFHSGAYETQVQTQITRMAILRELRTVPGLEGLRR